MNARNVIMLILSLVILTAFGCASDGYYYGGSDYYSYPYDYYGYYGYYPYNHGEEEEHEHHAFHREPYEFQGETPEVHHEFRGEGHEDHDFHGRADEGHDFHGEGQENQGFHEGMARAGK